jgi:RHS repeat-associated protein
VPAGGTGNSFQPTYAPTTNHIASVAGFTPTYDANGNVLNDGLNTYTWDVEGRPASVNGVSRTNDALNRPIEEGFPTEFFFSADNSGLVVFKGQDVAEGRYTLPAGIVATFNISNGGLQQYVHPDHLGSARFGSTPSRTYAFSVAYAPFGELYSRPSPNQAGFFAGLSPASFDLYDSPAREYSDQGRWASPDPAGVAAVNPILPQSWNRYAYVMNNPLGLVDPSGLICDGADGVGIAVGGKPADGTGIFTQEECEANGGTWIDPVYTTDTVTADPLPTQDGFTQYIQDFVNAYANISLTSVSVQLNRCAAQRVNSAYSKVIGNGKIVNAVAGNTFASLSQLALGQPNGSAGWTLPLDPENLGFLRFRGRSSSRQSRAIGEIWDSTCWTS